MFSEHSIPFIDSRDSGLGCVNAPLLAETEESTAHWTRGFVGIRTEATLIKGGFTATSYCRIGEVWAPETETTQHSQLFQDFVGDNFSIFTTLLEKMKNQQPKTNNTNTKGMKCDQMTR